MMVRFSVLGCGRIGRMHAANLARHPDAELVSVFDVRVEASAEVATALGVSKAESIDELLADPSVDAVLIATSTDTHVDLIIAAAKAGKAVLCEKPIDLSMERVERCWQEIAPIDPVVMIGFNRRFDPSFSTLRRRVQDGEIGKVEQVIITSRDPSPPPLAYINVSGGLFRDMMIHDFDIARFIVGDIEEVTAFGNCVVDDAIGATGDVDNAMVLLRSRSSVLVHINNNRRAAYGYDQRLEVFGATGMLLAENHRATSVRASNAQRMGAADVALPFFIERYKDAYALEISHFVDCVRNGGTPLASFRDGLEALKLADGANESLRTGRTVRLV